LLSFILCYILFLFSLFFIFTICSKKKKKSTSTEAYSLGGFEIVDRIICLLNNIGTNNQEGKKILMIKNVSFLIFFFFGYLIFFF
jgi:hypothetical protein